MESKNLARAEWHDGELWIYDKDGKLVRKIKYDQKE